MRNIGWVLVFLGFVTTVGTVGARQAHADDADTFFDDGIVHEIHITFADADWYDTLYDSHSNDPDDPYFPAGFEWNGVVLDPVGVRFKGNSSFSIPGVKKSFKIDFNKYDDDTTLAGLKKLNLNNGFKDPTLLREKLFLDFAGAFVPTIRVVYARLYVNGTLWGLYTAVEQVDKTFAQSRFGDDEDGNLFKAAASDDASDPNADFGSDLTWLGSDPTSYSDYYQLKTNETANDYSQLIEFINILNNQSPVDFPTLLEPVFDVQTALVGLALDNLFVNLDSYLAVAHNYYLYDRDDSGRITHVHWDANEAFGRFLLGVSGSQNPLELDPFWLPGRILGEEQERPLMENLWANSDYSNDYLCDLQSMLNQGFDAVTMQARIDELADLIRADVYADPNKMYSNSQFEQNLYSDIIDGRDTIYGLLNFVQQRAAYLSSRLDDFVLECSMTPSNLDGTLFINEFMAENDTTIQDPDGTGFPDWIEIFNAGSSAIDLGGLYMTDDLSDPTKWQVPLGVSIEANGYLLIWADNDEPQGDTHTNFKLSSDGEEIGLFDADGVSEIDSIVFGAQYADVSYGRHPDGTDSWDYLGAATPGSANGSHGEPPVITDAAHSPAWPTDGDVVWVTATVTDDGSVAGVALTYDAGGGAVEMTMLDDGAHGDGNAGDGVYGEQLPAQVSGTIVTYFLTATDNLGSISTDPSGAPSVTYSYLVGYTPPELFINEFMADNDTTIEDPDEAGAYDDWVEIYNAGDTTIDLGGMYLSDDAGDPTQWQIPAGVTIGPGAYLLFWADGDEDQGDTHANFKLSADGEFIGLYESDGNGNAVIDGVTFGPQETDVSSGRCPDGGSNWKSLAQATPGTSNTCETAIPDLCVPAAARLQGAGAFFTSRLELFNAADTNISVGVVFTPRADQDGSQLTKTVQLLPRQMLTVDDPLGGWFGFGDDESAVGSLMFTVIDGSPADLMVNGVITARTDNGAEYGQTFPATAIGDALSAGDTAYLNTTTNAERMRVNFGAAALSDQTVLEVQPVDPVGVALAEAKTLSLDAGVSRQINNLAKTYGLADAGNYLLEVNVIAGSAVVYLSVLDGNGDVSGTSDPTGVAPVTRGSERVTLLEMGSILGYDEWSGSASITNLSAEEVEIEAEFHRRDRPGVEATATLTLPPGETWGHDDLVGELFGTTGVGTVVLNAPQGGEIMASGREFSIFRDDDGEVDGTAGTSIPGMTDDEQLQSGITYHLLGLRQRETEAGLERSHVAAFNPGENDVELTMFLYDGSSGAYEGWATLTLGAGELVQTNNIINTINPDQDGAPKRLEVTTNGPIFVKAFRVNPYGDSVTIDALN